MGFDSSSHSRLRRTALFLSALALSARARTNAFDDADDALFYFPPSDWSVESDEEAFREGVHSTTTSGASLSFAFEGE